MRIFALDLGVRAGYAIGDAGARPDSGTVTLKNFDEHRAVAFSNLICFLNESWTADRPALVVKEAMLPLQAFKTLGNAEHTIRMTAGLHAVVEAMCVRHGIHFEEVADSTARKHFIGRARMGARKDTKAAVIQRCHVLGYMARTCKDDNRADALATWDWAAAHFGGRTATVLHLFGENAA